MGRDVEGFYSSSIGSVARCLAKREDFIGCGKFRGKPTDRGQVGTWSRGQWIALSLPREGGEAFEGTEWSMAGEASLL
jgi:hypothetical protein